MATYSRIEYAIKGLVTISPNYHDLPQCLYIDIESGAYITVSAAASDLVAYSNGNDPKWTLSGESLYLNAVPETSKAYIYAKLAKNGSAGIIAITSAPVSTKEDGTVNVISMREDNTTDLFIYLGYLTEVVDNARTIHLDYGCLGSVYSTRAENSQNSKHAEHADHADTATNAAHASEADHATKAEHAVIADAALEADHATESDHALESDHTLEADHSALTADLDTALWTRLDNRYLRKDKDDETTHTLTMAGANIKGTANVEEDLEVGGTSRLQTTTFGTPQEAPGGVGTINGAEITKGGGIKARSLELSEFLEVPEVRFNRASLIVGTNIQSPCAGIIKTVSPIDEFTGIATLELGDDDIAGSIQEGALCWGYFHDTTHRENNATESSDDRQGNIEYHGFATVYFQIAHIYSPADGDYPNNSSVFRYELREGYHLHPYPAMHFGGRGNTKDTNLQGFTIKTPDYEATYQNVGSWDWSDLAKYVVKVQGKLDGFESLAGLKPGTWKNHYGTIETNLYYRGELKQVDLGRSFLFITQESNGMIEEGETEKVSIVIRNQSFGIATAAYNITINGVAHSVDEGTEALVLEYPYADLADELTRYTVVCTHKADATQKLEGSFTIRKLAPRILKIESDQQNDPFISTDAPRHVEFRVVTNTGLDLTEQVTKWTIARESSNADADKIWALRDKAKNFQGIIDIYWSYDAAINDIDLNAPITKFHISATVGTETLTHTHKV